MPLLLLLLASQCVSDTAKSKAVKNLVQSKRSEEIFDQSTKAQAAQLFTKLTFVSMQ